MSDDEVQIIERPSIIKRSVNNDVCQLCSFKFDGLSLEQRQHHYNEHYADGPSASTRSTRGRPNPTSSSNPPKKSVGAAIKKVLTIRKEEEEDIFWYPAQASEPPKNHTPGLLPILKDALKRSHVKGATKRAVLCYERTTHIAREGFDVNWGCAYRNFLMACSALMDQQIQAIYSSHLGDPTPPSVRNLQQWIEDAWKKGYDPVGADELAHELVGTRTRLGTGELYVAFTFRRIPCTLLDFDIQKSPKGFDAVTSWVVSYFDEEVKPKGDVNTALRSVSPVVATKKMPIIMQFEGHSVTIVGFEITKNSDVNLLIFDPSSKVKEDLRAVALAGPGSVEWNSSSGSGILGKSKRRESSKSPVSNKRPRQEQDAGDDVICVETKRGKATESAEPSLPPQATLQVETVIKAFRIAPKHKKHSHYQLLYFTMNAPLSDEEQNQRKVVYSEIVC